MSHFSLYKTTLVGVTVSQLVECVKNLAEQIKAQTTTEIYDWQGKNPQTVSIGLKLKSLPNGIGFNIGSDGKVEAIGDSYNHEEEYLRITKLTENYIKAIKVSERASALNPNTQLRMAVREHEVILEVATP